MHLLTNLHDDKPHAGPCVFNDMTQRLPEPIKKELDDLLEHIQDSPPEGWETPTHLFVQQAAIILDEAPPLDRNATQHCEKHNRPCLVNPLGTPGATTLLVAGVSCIDYTSMGKRRGIVGEGVLPFMTLMHEVKQKKYDITIIECTPAFSQANVAQLLGPQFCVQSATFSPTDLGHPASRSRKYTVALYRDRRIWAHGKTLTTRALLAEFGRSMQVTGSIYLSATPAADIHGEIAKMAARRHMPERDGQGRRWPMRLTLPLGAERRLRSHELKISDPSADWFCYVCQSEGYGRCSPHVPALLRKSQVWSMKHKRLLLPMEHARVMNMRLTAGLKSLTDNQVRSVAGNAMHGTALGAVLLYVFAYTECVSPA